MSIKQAIEALEELVEYAEEAGFDWSLDNARAALAALRSMPQGEPQNIDYVSQGLVDVWKSRATPHTEAVRMSEAEIREIAAKWFNHSEMALKMGVSLARAVEQATAARLGVKMGDV